MGRPNYPCIQLSSPYSKYVDPSPSGPIDPYDIDYFVLPDENAPCPPYSNTIYRLNLPTKNLNSFFIKVSDILISSVGCTPFSIELSGPDKNYFDISSSGLYFNSEFTSKKDYIVDVVTKNLVGNIIDSDRFYLYIDIICTSTTVTPTTSTTQEPTTTTSTSTSTSTTLEPTTSTSTSTSTTTSTTCEPIPPSTLFNELYEGCTCISSSEYTSPNCYLPSGIGLITEKTYLVDIPINPYFFPGQQPAPPLASGLLCDNPATQFRISNRIKIIIPDDPIFSGTYVFDRLSSYNWWLNEEQSEIYIPKCQGFNEFGALLDPVHLIDFTEQNNPSDPNQTYIEELDDSQVYAFPAKYHVCITKADTRSLTDELEIDHRLSVGFNIPIRYRHAYGDWIVVDRLFNNNIKTPHIIIGSPNYAYKDGSTNKYTFLDLNGDAACGSGLNELGFSFRASGNSLSENGCNNICSYPYFSNNGEESWFTPKIPVKALIEFVYDCRSTINCNIANNTNLNNNPSLIVDNVVCLGSTINVDHECTTPDNLMRLYVISLTNNLNIYFKDTGTGTTFRIDGVINEAIELPIIGSSQSIKSYINDFFAIYDTNNNRYKCVDLYVISDPYVNESEEGPQPCVIIVASDDC